MDPDHSDAFWSTGFALVFLFLFLIVFIPAILTLISVSNLLSVIAVENRKMSPEQVWLVLIPVFGLIWQFIMIHRLSDSLALEFKKRDMKPDEDRPAFNIGIATCILFVMSNIPFALVTLIIFWVKIDRYRKAFEAQAMTLDAVI